MDESEADTSSTGSETEEASVGDTMSDGSGHAPASSRGDADASSQPPGVEDGAHTDAPTEDGELGHDPGGSNESLKLGPLVGVREDADMMDADPDDVAEFLPEPQRPPGIRPPYRGLSITIPPEEDEDPGFSGRPAAVGSPGLTIKIWKVHLSPCRPCSSGIACSQHMLSLPTLQQPA